LAISTEKVKLGVFSPKYWIT